MGTEAVEASKIKFGGSMYQKGVWGVHKIFYSEKETKSNSLVLSNGEVLEKHPNKILMSIQWMIMRILKV